MIETRGINIKNFIKKIFWGGLYLSAFLAALFSIAFFSEKDLTASLWSFLISIIIYTFLIAKDIRFLSSLSFITMIPISLIILGVAGNQTNGNFPSAFDEKAFMLSLALILCFFIINCTFWITTKHGWRKLISWFFLILAFLILLICGLVPPDYHQNFVYTRVFILIFFMFSIFLIMKRQKLLRVLGILGIFLSIGFLFMSAAFFAGETYIIEGSEKDLVLIFLDPKVKEMFGYYNQNDFDNFCKYCSPLLENNLKSDPRAIQDWRSLHGRYLDFKEPEVVRARGFYFIEYPVEFQNTKNLSYLTFMLSDISPESTILGFNLSEEKGQ